MILSQSLVLVKMADQGNKKPTALSPAFASLLNKANKTVIPKPNFGNQRPKPNFSLKNSKHDSPKLSTVQAAPESSATAPQSSMRSLAKPISFGTLASQREENQKTITPSPFANLMNKNRDVKQNFGSSALEKISAKYLNSNQSITPKFGSSFSSPPEPTSSSTITCPIFQRSASSPADQSNDIRPLRSPLPTSKEIEIPQRVFQDTGSVLSTSTGSSDYGSPSAKFTFSPIPNKTQSPAQTFAGDSSPNQQDSKLSSLSKLKDRYVKNARNDNCPGFDGGSPSSPSLDDNRSKRFNFDLSSALITRKDPVQNISGPSSMMKILTPKRPIQEHTIVVDQLSCVLDARTLLNKPSQHNTATAKHMSNMGKVICKKWKGGACENLPVRFNTPYRIPAFKFDTMSPDDEIQSKFKRRR